jgi:hypothetical protein
VRGGSSRCSPRSRRFRRTVRSGGRCRCRGTSRCAGRLGAVLNDPRWSMAVGRCRAAARGADAALQDPANPQAGDRRLTVVASCLFTPPPPAAGHQRLIYRAGASSVLQSIGRPLGSRNMSPLGEWTSPGSFDRLQAGVVGNHGQVFAHVSSHLGQQLNFRGKAGLREQPGRAQPHRLGHRLAQIAAKSNSAIYLANVMPTPVV